MAKIAVLFSEGDNNPKTYVVHYLAEHWRQAGHEVVYLMGTGCFIPADLLFLHVDLSVVPAAYLHFANRYPRVLNRRITDIRKSRVSRLLVGPNDSWSGPVIIKSDLNYGGIPERAFGRTWLERRFPTLKRARNKAERVVRRHTKFLTPLEYQIYPDLGGVPKSVFRSAYWVVEKFLPEVESGFYHLRMYQFLGDRYLSTRLASKDQMIKVVNSSSITDIDPHPIVEQWRRDFGLDYGKLDYVVHDGEPILLDINKTVGAVSGPRNDAEVNARRQFLAAGINAFL